MLRMVDLIEKKRNGFALSDAEIEFIINGYTSGEIPDYQMSAWLMAVYFKGMQPQEIAVMTLAMARSGKMVDLSMVPGIKVDKHSTGGVADTTTLVVAPLVAAAGVPVAKMSGRGLGFTGGTIDKLDAISGLTSTLSQAEFIDALCRHGIAVIGQSKDIAPADGKIYALRDVTSTVDSIPLIASSIMSKKIASGADKILLDVKVGNGAFMKDLPSAIALAETMVNIGQLVGRETRAIISSMEEPLGLAIGNSLEVEEAIDILSGKGSDSLREVCVYLAATMLLMAKEAKTLSEAEAKVNELLSNGAALRKFAEFITTQGGSADLIENRDLLPQALYRSEVTAEKSGYIQAVKAAQLGYSAMTLGAGREFKGQEIDLAAGVMLHCRVGDAVNFGESLATIYANKEDKIAVARELILDAISIGEAATSKTKLILGTVDQDGFKAV